MDASRWNRAVRIEVECKRIVNRAVVPVDGRRQVLNERASERISV